MDTAILPRPSLHLDADALHANYDRTPFGFSHDLHTLPLFEAGALERLAQAYDGHRADYFVAGSAAAPGTVFYDVPTKELTAAQALARLAEEPTRLLLKRPENHDAGFRRLLDDLFADVAAKHGTLRRDDLIRLEGAILITSAASTTPFHFDPEIGFFSQIEGPKTYHLYPPASLTEVELEQFYRRGIIDIGQVDIAARNPADEHVFHLRPGLGLHQPQNSPHWVQTHGERSVSYTFVFETKANRQQGRARGFNHYLRQIGLSPAKPGVNAGGDKVKATTIRAAARVKRALKG